MIGERWMLCFHAARLKSRLETCLEMPMKRAPVLMSLLVLIAAVGCRRAPAPPSAGARGDAPAAGTSGQFSQAAQTPLAAGPPGQPTPAAGPSGQSSQPAQAAQAAAPVKR